MPSKSKAHCPWSPDDQRAQATNYQLRCVALIMLLSVAVSSLACTGIGPSDRLVPIQLPPDPCVLTNFSLLPLQQIDLPAPGNGIRILVDSAVWSQLPRQAYVVLIVNGNGFEQQDYEDLANFLARQGFIAVIAERANLTTSVEVFVIEALAATFAELGLDADTAVALIGHSVGGGVVVNSAIYNHTFAAGFNIRAVVGLAPNLANVNHLNGNHTPAYLLVYGSQDEDVEGDNTTLSDAFAGYDAAGTESSTTCNIPPCLQFQPPFERTMVYVHGAGHAGLVNRLAGVCLTGNCDPVSAYLTTSDQFCIAKGYTNAFLRWKLRGEAIYKPILRGVYTPPSIASITTNAADYQGNPADRPLRLFFQVSPIQRRSIENFEDNDYDLNAVSPAVVWELAGPGDHADAPHYVRHQTNYLLVGWPSRNQNQWIGFQVPAPARNATHFSRLALRVGQFGGAPVDYENPLNQNQTLQICLIDGRSASCEWSTAWGTIPPNDPQPDNVAHSVMNTLSIRLSAFSGINRANIEAILLLLPAHTQGTLMIDSLEWFRD